MKSLKLDPITHDLVLNGQNELVFIDGDEELLQCIERIISTNLGEWLLNPEFGFDRYEILGQKYNRQRAIDEIYAAILQEERIDSIENLEIDFDRKSRKLNVSFKLIKTDGERLEGEVNANGIRV